MKSSAPNKKKEKANAIEKSLRILMSFAPQNREVRTSDLSQQLGYNLATVSRTLQILKRQGFVQQNSRTKLFRLGPSISQLAAAVRRSMRSEFVHIAKPYADELSESVGSSVTIEVLASENTMIAYNIPGNGPLQVSHVIGESMAAHASAGGKAILAFSAPEAIAKHTIENMPRFTDFTITDPSAFQKEMDKIRKRGYAVDRQELHIGVVAVAAPIFNSENKPIAAIAIAGPKYQIGDQLDSILAERVKSTAQQISSELYHNDCNSPLTTE